MSMPSLGMPGSVADGFNPSHSPNNEAKEKRASRISTKEDHDESPIYVYALLAKENHTELTWSSGGI